MHQISAQRDTTTHSDTPLLLTAAVFCPCCLADKQAKLFTGQVITYQRVLQKSTNLTNYKWVSGS